MADGNIKVEVSTQAAQAELERLRAENAALKRDLQYARDGLTKGRTRMREDNERLTEALRELVDLEDMRLRLRQLHEMGHGTDYENYHRRLPLAWTAARKALGPIAQDRPSTPVGWSDTDWLKHLEEIQQNEAAYHRGPLPERGWD